MLAGVPALGEDLAVDLVDVGADPLEHVGRAIDDRLDQPDKHLCQGLTAATRLAGAREELAEGAEIFVAERRDTLAGDDDREGRKDRLAAIDPGEQAYGHVDGAVLGIEAARELDLLRLLAGRQAGAEKGFRRAILLGAGLEHIHPAGAVGHKAALVARQWHRPVFGEAIGNQHLLTVLRPITLLPAAKTYQALPNRVRPIPGTLAGACLAVARNTASTYSAARRIFAPAVVGGVPRLSSDRFESLCQFER